MLINTADDEGFYGGKYLPARLAERAAKVTDDPLQLSLSAYRSTEALHLCREARLDLIRIRQSTSAEVHRRDGLEGTQRFDQ